MKIYWLKARCKEVSFVNRPAIDKRFIAIKTMEDEDDKNKSFADRIGNKIKNKLGLVETKIGRVLSKSNEAQLLTAANDIVKAGETVKAVLLTVQKNSKKEDREMEEKDVKKIVEEAIDEKLDAFKTSIEDTLEKLLSTKEEDSEDEEEENEEEDADEEDDSDDSEEDSEDEEEDSENDKKSKKKVSKKKSTDDVLLASISEIVDKKFEEVKSEVDGIKKELKIKPKSDKQKEKKKEEKADEDKEADYTGAFGIDSA